MENKFAENLIECLRINGIKQNELAINIGASRQAVHGWCSGAHEPSYNMLIKICKVLDETPTSMLEYDILSGD